MSPTSQTSDVKGPAQVLLALPKKFAVPVPRKNRAEPTSARRHALQWPETTCMAPLSLIVEGLQFRGAEMQHYKSLVAAAVILPCVAVAEPVPDGIYDLVMADERSGVAVVEPGKFVRPVKPAHAPSSLMHRGMCEDPRYQSRSRPSALILFCNS